MGFNEINTGSSTALSGKRILITGGTTGIGREIAILLTSLGGNCLICGRNREQLDETIAAAKNGDSTGSCQGVVTELANGDEIKVLYDEVDARLGGLDILINNAALGFGSVTEGGYDQISYIIQTNLIAYLACSHYAIARMQQQGEGHIVNIGSMSADVREKGSSVYVATKSAIQGFSEALRKELNPEKIKVTLIEPGAVDTDMQMDSTEEKYRQVEDLEMLPAIAIAKAVAYCLSQPPGCEVVGMQIKPQLQLI
ncbi:short-subunit dehydrogenase [Pedobacter sp. W3I1]|uniref:SDR family oxidoreductase n=1 Tax=Pedobacter sp. W3I1 TaxID=3042291 RepID=UPI00277DD5B0|nr:SDR family oxidoreductase [Pedobacter sp. W3I1]MDQ0639954.1 short-subunit dehydrogenase [Pedobacter sp. W3I1]